MSKTIYGRIVNKREFKQIRRDKTLRSQDQDQLIPVFHSPNGLAMMDYFYKVADGKKFKDKLKRIHKAFGGRGDAYKILFFTTDIDPVVSDITFRNPPVPNIREAKFSDKTSIEIIAFL